MRLIGPLPTICFGTLLSIPVSLTWAFYAFASSWFVEPTPMNFFMIIAGCCFTFFFGLLCVYRFFISCCPIPEGDLQEGSRGEFYWMISAAFWVLFLNLIVVNHIVPVPMTRILYKILGARVGKNTYFSGTVLDPQFTTFGSNVVVGLGSIIIPHVIEGKRLAHFQVQVGDNVTIGAQTTILAGTKIGSGSMVGAMSLVPKNTVIGDYELWAGVPAKFIRKLPTI